MTAKPRCPACHTPMWHDAENKEIYCPNCGYEEEKDDEHDG